jgi:DNA-directed RNA polymerase specialized sigma24 family protein
MTPTLCYRCTERDALPGSDYCAECSGVELAAEARPRLFALSREAAYERINATPATWLIDGIMSSVDYGALVGPKGVGKSLALEDLAVSIALGDAWFGRFPTSQGRALILTCEEHEGRTWKRLDAIAASKGRDPDELEGWVHVHPIPFSAIDDVDLLDAEVEAVGPALTVLDPAYKYLAGAKSNLIFDMGAVLTPLQVACQRHGSALFVGHHYNRKEGAGRQERVAGAGILEWARLLVTIELRDKLAEADKVRVDVSGNSIGDTGFDVARSVVALDESANPDLSYHVEVTAEGAEQKAEPWTARRRVLALLPTDQTKAMTKAEVQDATVDDASGLRPLRTETVKKALQELHREGEVDAIEAVGQASLWWRVPG